MKSRLAKFLIRGATALITLSSIALADVHLVYYVDIFGPPNPKTTPTASTTLPVGPATLAPANTSLSVLVPMFNQASDPNLGFKYQLTGVNIELDWSTLGSLKVFNITEKAVPFTKGTTSIPLTITAPSISVYANAATGPISGRAACCLAVTTFPGLTKTGAAVDNVAPVNYGLYEGNGVKTLTFGVASDAGSYGGSSPGDTLFFGGSATAGGILKVDYSYIEVKAVEAGTISLLLVMLAGFAGFAGVLKKKLA